MDSVYLNILCLNFFHFDFFLMVEVKKWKIIGNWQWFGLFMQYLTIFCTNNTFRKIGSSSWVSSFQFNHILYLNNDLPKSQVPNIEWELLVSFTDKLTIFHGGIRTKKSLSTDELVNCISILFRISFLYDKVLFIFSFFFSQRKHIIVAMRIMTS